MTLACFPNSPNEWAARLREAIEHRRISRLELALRVGIRPNTLSDILNERREPSVNTLVRLMRALRVLPDYVMWGQLPRYFEDHPVACQEPTFVPPERKTQLPKEPSAERIGLFWSQVDRDGPMSAHAPHLGPCWLWTGASGSFSLLGESAVYRVAYVLSNGPIPSGKMACHACGNGHMKCVRPSHIYAGTAADNATDAMRMGVYVRRRSA